MSSYEILNSLSMTGVIGSMGASREIIAPNRSSNPRSGTQCEVLLLVDVQRIFLLFLGLDRTKAERCREPVVWVKPGGIRHVG